jgi:DegV family protein with EDD domain
MIKIATDSIADLPADLVKQRNITIIPAWLHLKTGKVRTDTVNVQELYDLLAEEPGIPRTDPLSEEEYCEIFTGLVGVDDTLVLVSASKRISRVFEIASSAAQKVAADRIFVHDSVGVSLWQGFQALRAAQLAAAGQNVEMILSTLSHMREQTHFFFVLDNLNYLHQGGRVNMAQYMLSVVFDVKPVLTIQEGLIVPIGRVRGRERAAIDMQMRLLEAMKGVPNVWMGIVHTKAPEQAQKLSNQLQATLRPSYSLIADCGPTISAHAGPNGVGAVVCPA